MPTAVLLSMANAGVIPNRQATAVDVKKFFMSGNSLFDLISAANLNPFWGTVKRQFGLTDNFFCETLLWLTKVAKMRLQDWMEKTDTDIIETARMFGVSVYAVKKWLRGDRIPRDDMKRKIRKLTKGLVDGNDWIEEIR